MNKRCRITGTIVLLLLLFCCNALLAQRKWTYTDLPDPKASPSWNYVSNPDTILNDSTVTTINNWLKDLENSTTDQVAVVVVKDIQADKTPKDFATDLFRLWGIGQKDKNNGLLILLVVNQRRMEFEVGYGLESTLTDILTKQIQERYMVPYAKSGDYNNCVIAGVEQVIAVLKQEEPVSGDAGYEAPSTPDNHVISYADTYSDSGTPKINTLPVLLIIIAILFIYFIIKKLILAKASLNAGNSFRTLRYQFIQFLINVVFIAAILLGSIYERFWQLAIVVYLMFLIKQLVKVRAILKHSRSAHQLFSDRVETYKNVRLHKLAIPTFLKYIFPFPTLLFHKQIAGIIEQVRNQPVFSSDGKPMSKLNEEADDAYLKPNQVYEEEMSSVDYDVWQAEHADEQQIFRYELFSKYETCPKCDTVAYHLIADRTIYAATYDSSGEGEKTYQCGYCHYEKKTRYTIPRKQRSSSSSGSSGSSGSGGSSWGGGSSGGGGSGSSW